MAPNGKPGRYDALVERWHPSLWSRVRSMTGDPGAAEDILQAG